MLWYRVYISGAQVESGTCVVRFYHVDSSVPAMTKWMDTNIISTGTTNTGKLTQVTSKRTIAGNEKIDIEVIGGAQKFTAKKFVTDDL